MVFVLSKHSRATKKLGQLSSGFEILRSVCLHHLPDKLVSAMGRIVCFIELYEGDTGSRWKYHTWATMRICLRR